MRPMGNTSLAPLACGGGYLKLPELQVTSWLCFLAFFKVFLACKGPAAFLRSKNGKPLLSYELQNLGGDLRAQGVI